MDEREQELNALREYGFKLLEKMRYQELLEMLQGTLTHLHDIAAEYSNEANSWRVKYDECEAHNRQLQQQLQDLKNANNDQVDKLQKTIQIQSDAITELEKEFNRKIGELRSYRDSEVQHYNEQIQSLILAQQSLANMKRELEDKLHECDSEKTRLENLKRECEEMRAELQRKIEVNQTKLDRYDELDNFQRNAQQRIDELEKALYDKEEEANNKIKDLNKELETERKRKQELERQLDELKRQPSSDNNNSVSQPGAEENFTHNDADDDDDTK